MNESKEVYEYKCSHCRQEKSSTMPPVKYKKPWWQLETHYMCHQCFLDISKIGDFYKTELFRKELEEARK